VNVKANPLLARAPSIEDIAVTAFFLVLLILFFDRWFRRFCLRARAGCGFARIRYLLEAPLLPGSAGDADAGSAAVDRCAGRAGGRFGGGASVGGDGGAAGGGEEEGILEESDRELVRSAVEFGDKVVREVMTPRPAIFAVPESLSLAGLLEKLRRMRSRACRCFAGTLDHVTGIVLRATAACAGRGPGQATVAQLQKPTAFVPETKKWPNC